MEKYQDLIARIGQYLIEIDSVITRPLSEVANKYRQAAEAICKAMIVANNKTPEGMLEKLISDC